MTAVPNRLPSQLTAQPFVVEIDRFRGPLDLLLHLIRSQDIDIFDIPISQITHQFHEALTEGIERLELDRAGEFLELAATLVRIKAQLLLPGRGDTEWEDDPRAELVRRLLEYELFQEIARVLGAAELERRRHLAKGYLPPPEPREAEGVELSTTLEDFLEAVSGMPAPDPIRRHVAPIRVVAVEDKVAVIRRLLGERERVPFNRLFTSWADRHHVVAALLACLELARQQFLRLEQVKRFGAIWMFGRKPVDVDTEGGSA
ncbi:segregation and condensation protein A [Candidatus Palauibacter sp.]|uniref:segregation and condensation protein A n=1 Tax=Candidatus Palauibacter sp. TaxID=3101350 RepID=UPI003B5CA995